MQGDASDRGLKHMNVRMRSSAARVAALVMVVSAGFAKAAPAAPITFQMSGVNSGQIGGTSFTNKLITVTATADTADIETVFGFALAAPLLTTTVTIEGVGTATVTDPMMIFSSIIAVDICGGCPVLPYVVMGRIDSPPALDSFTGLGVVGDAALLGYDLTTAFDATIAFGGLGWNPLCSTPGHDPCLGTTLGPLRTVDDEVRPVRFRASAVPEPAGLILMGSAVAAFFGRSRLRGRRG